VHQVDNLYIVMVVVCEFSNHSVTELITKGRA